MAVISMSIALTCSKKKKFILKINQNAPSLISAAFLDVAPTHT